MLPTIRPSEPVFANLEFLDGTYFWEANPRYAQADQSDHDKYFRAAVGVDANGASLGDAKDVSTYSHMFGCWETLYVIKAAVEQSGYQSPSAKDKAALVETLEGMKWFNEGIEHPQGHKQFIGQIHQCFGQQFISKVESSKLNVVHRTTIEDGLYEPEADYTTQPL